MTEKCVIIFADESNEDICEEEREYERARRPVHDVLALCLRLQHPQGTCFSRQIGRGVVANERVRLPIQNILYKIRCKSLTIGAEIMGIV